MPHKDPEVRKAYLKEHHKRWYEKNKEKRRKQISQYKRANPTKIANSNAAYRSRPEVRAAATRRKQEWREKNRERDRMTRRVWARGNRDKLRSYDRRYRSDRSSYNRAYYEANRDRIRQRDAIRYIVRRDSVTKEQFDLMMALSFPSPT